MIGMMTRNFTKLLRLAAVVAIAAVVVPASGPANASASGAWCPAVSANHGVVNVIGDSIMHGMPESSPAWHVGIWDWFRTNNKPNVQMWTGAAVGGSQVADFLPGGSLYGHTQFAVAHNPQLIVIGLGTNAHLSNLSPATFDLQYRQLLSLLPAGSTKLLVHNNWVNWTQWQRNYDQRAYLAVLEQIATDTGYPLLKLSDALSVGTVHYMSDGIHASALGEYEKFKAFRTKLTEMCL